MNIIVANMIIAKMKKILPFLMLSTIVLLSCSDNSYSNKYGVSTQPKILNEMIGTYDNSVFNAGTILIADGAISISKNVSNYGAISLMLGLTKEQMQSSITSLTFHNVEASVGMTSKTFPTVTLQISEQIYDASHGYTGTNQTYTQIECTIDYNTGKETFIVHNAECCSVNSTIKSLFRR